MRFSWCTLLQSSETDLFKLFAGLMISGFARAGTAVKNSKYVELATDAAKFVERHLFDKDEGVLLRSCYHGENDEILQTWVWSSRSLCRSIRRLAKRHNDLQERTDTRF